MISFELPRFNPHRGERNVPPITCADSSLISRPLRAITCLEAPLQPAGMSRCRIIPAKPPAAKSLVVQMLEL
jgi:hypothetical protein